MRSMPHPGVSNVDECAVIRFQGDSNVLFQDTIWAQQQECRTWARLAVPAAAVEAPAHAVTETATKTRMHKAGASEPRMEEARVTKAEASEVWTEKAAAEPAVPASAKSDGNSDRPSPAPWVTPIPARCIIRVIPGVILWRIIRIALCLNGGASR
jgi:hypothetical protein